MDFSWLKIVYCAYTHLLLIYFVVEKMKKEVKKDE